MSVARERSLVRSSFRLAWPNEKAVITILLAVFFALHVLADALLQDQVQTNSLPTREEARIPLHD